MPQQANSNNLSPTAKAEAKARRKRTFIWIGAAVLVIGGGVTAAILLNKAKAQNPLDRFTPAKDDPPSLPPVKTTTTTTSSGGGSGGGSRWTSDRSFPLRKMMKGERVKVLQRGMNKTFGSGLKVDGYWGSLTQGALDTNNVSTPISAAAWGRMLQHMRASDPYGFQPGGTSGQSAGGGTGQGGGSNSTGNFSPAGLAAEISAATNSRDANRVVSALRLMRTVQDYTNVSDLLKSVNAYETRDKQGGKVNRNLVNTLMADRMPWNFSHKSAFAAELRRMGLKQNGDRWSLSGLGSIGAGRMAVTREGTVLWGEGNVLQDVPGGVLVGTVTGRRGDVIQLLTPTGKTAFAQAGSLVIA